MVGHVAAKGFSFAVNVINICLGQLTRVLFKFLLTHIAVCIASVFVYYVS